MNSSENKFNDIRFNVKTCFAFVFLFCFIFGMRVVQINHLSSIHKNISNEYSANNSNAIVTDAKDEEFQNWLKIQGGIRQRISRVCEKYKNSLYKIAIPRFYLMFDKKSKLFYCENAKVKREQKPKKYLKRFKEHNQFYV